MALHIHQPSILSTMATARLRAQSRIWLARSEASTQRFCSMWAQIREERKAYYDILEATQRGDVDITMWLEWFLGCLSRAIEGAEETLGSILEKARFWEYANTLALNDRQKFVLNRLFDGFEGKLNSSKWAKLTKTSPDTALRDITDLIEHGILKRDASGGRSTSYSLVRRGAL